MFIAMSLVTLFFSSLFYTQASTQYCTVKVIKFGNHSLLIIIVSYGSEFMGKTFQAAQLTHERFLTIDHSCKIFFWYLPNWTSMDLWCVVLYVTYSTTHQRSVEVQFGRYKKKMFCRSDLTDLWSKISHMLVVQLETFSPYIHYCHAMAYQHYGYEV